MTDFKQDYRQGAVGLTQRAPRQRSGLFLERLRHILAAPDAAVSKRFLVPSKKHAITFFRDTPPLQHP